MAWGLLIHDLILKFTYIYLWDVTDEGGADSSTSKALLFLSMHLPFSSPSHFLSMSTNRATCEMAGHGLRDSMRSMDIGSSSDVGMRNGSVTESMCCRGQRAKEGTLGYGHSRCGMAPYRHHNPLRLFYFPSGNLLSSVLCDGHFLCLDLQGDWSQLSLMYYRSVCIIYFFSFLVIWFDQSVIQLVKTVASDDDLLMIFAT
jgi:hypothetical protein